VKFIQDCCFGPVTRRLTFALCYSEVCRKFRSLFSPGSTKNLVVVVSFEIMKFNVRGKMKSETESRSIKAIVSSCGEVSWQAAISIKPVAKNIAA